MSIIIVILFRAEEANQTGENIPKLLAAVIKLKIVPSYLRFKEKKYFRKNIYILMQTPKLGQQYVADRQNDYRETI